MSVANHEPSYVREWIPAGYQSERPGPIADLVAAAGRVRTKRTRAEAHGAAAAKARKDREAAFARERHLAALELRVLHERKKAFLNQLAAKGL